MVDDAVDDGGRHLVVAEHRAPPAGLEVGGDHRGLPLAGVREHLEQRARPVRVERQEARLVDDEEPGPPNGLRLPVQPTLVPRT